MWNPSVVRKMRPAREVGTPAAPSGSAPPMGSTTPSHCGPRTNRLTESVVPSTCCSGRSISSPPGNGGVSTGSVPRWLPSVSCSRRISRPRSRPTPGLSKRAKAFASCAQRAERGHLALPPDERRRKPSDLLTCRQLRRRGLPTRREVPRDFGLTRCLTVEVGKESTLKRERCRSCEHAAVGFERCH